MKNLLALLTIVFLINTSFTNAQPPKKERERTYDVKHISLNIGFDWTNKSVAGTCTTTISPLNTLSDFEVDAIDFNIISIKDNSGKALKYDYDKKKIKIYTGRQVSSSEDIIYTVDYTCTPIQGIYFRYPTELNPNTPHQIWTQGEDEDNRYYIPCYDYPNDKTTTEMYIRIDKNYKTLSNGYLESSVDISPTERVDHWIQDKPHSTYLMMIGAGEYEILNDSYNGVPILNYVNPDKVELGRYAFRNTPEMMKTFNQAFGYNYPWAKLGQIVINDFIVGGMENTSAITYNERVYYPQLTEKDYGGDGLISHEFTHQWWGDLITCRNWEELWLNESFATYGTSIWKEHKGGKDEYDYDLLSNSDNAIRSDSVSGAYPIWAGYKNVTAKIYDKGGKTIGFFRDILGDKFFPALSTFLHDNEFANVETMDLEKAFDKADPGPDKFGNEDHKWMFEDYIWKGGYPVFMVKYSYDESKKNLNLKVDQVQKPDSLGLTAYRAPVNVRIYSDDQELNEKVWIDKASQEFNFKFNSYPEFVQFDAGNKMHDVVRYDRSKTDCINQILHSKDAIDRILAIREIINFPYDRIVPDVLKNVLVNDTFWGTKVEVAKALGKVPKLAHNILLEQLKNEKDSRVISAILTALVQFKDRKDIDVIKNYIKNENDEYIVRDGIKTIVGLSNTDEISDVVLPYAERRSHRNIIQNEVISALRSLEGKLNLKPTEPIRNALMNIAYGKDYDYRLRDNAINALSFYADEPIVKETSLKYIDYNNPSTQRAIINLLGKSKDRSMIDMLQKFKSSNRYPSVDKAINDAIEKLSK